jgi:RHS repeat-associated protein
VQAGVAQENDTLHVIDNQNRIALVRVGVPFPGDASPVVAYHLGDHLGSSNITIDAGGAWTNREEYSPYGETSFGSFARKRYRFTGKERDEESGLYYHGARYYAPWVGRWVSCDPIGLGDGFNVYAYGRSNPVNSVDPSGTQSISTAPGRESATPSTCVTPQDVCSNVEDYYEVCDEDLHNGALPKDAKAANELYNTVQKRGDKSLPAFVPARATTVPSNSENDNVDLGTVAKWAGAIAWAPLTITYFEGKLVRATMKGIADAIGIKTDDLEGLNSAIMMTGIGGAIVAQDQLVAGGEALAAKVGAKLEMMSIEADAAAADAVRNGGTYNPPPGNEMFVGDWLKRNTQIVVDLEVPAVMADPVGKAASAPSGVGFVSVNQYGGVVVEYSSAGTIAANRVLGNILDHNALRTQLTRGGAADFVVNEKFAHWGLKGFDITTWASIPRKVAAGKDYIFIGYSADWKKGGIK